MRKICWVLACLACTSYGRRVQMTAERFRSHVLGGVRERTPERVHGSLHENLQGAQETDATSSRESSIKLLTVLFLAFNNISAGKRYTALDSAITNAAASVLPVQQVRPLMVSGRDSDEVERKRIKAERLALEAEKTLLEATRLQLLAEELRAQRVERQPEEEVVPFPAPAAAPVESPLSDAAGPSEPIKTPPPSSATSSPSDGFWSKQINTLNANSEDEPQPLAVKRIEALLTGKSLDSFQLSEKQIEMAKRQVFDTNSFHITEVEQTCIGTMFRGSLCTNSSIAIESVTSKAAEVLGLQDVKFLLLQDPTYRYRLDGQGLESVFLALPTTSTTLEQKFPEFILALFSLLFIAFANANFALQTYSLADGSAMLKALETGDATPLLLTVPIVVGLCGLQLLHELAHFVAAQVYSVKTGLPVFVPCLEIGNMGAVTRLLSFPKNRTVLFDFALAGPAVAGSLSFALYLLGLFLSADLPTPDMTEAMAGYNAMPDLVRSAATVLTSSASSSADMSTYTSSSSLVPIIPTSFLQRSWLLSSLARLIVPAANTGTLIALHPLALIGFIGVFVNALQLLPVGRLDGGRILTAVLGEQTAGLASILFTLAFAIYNLINGDPVLQAFGLFLFFFQRRQDIPCTDDVSQVDSRRESLAIIVAAVVLFTLWELPATSPFPLSPFSGDMQF